VSIIDPALKGGAIDVIIADFHELFRLGLAEKLRIIIFRCAAPPVSIQNQFLCTKTIGCS
jgi:hypothetical protein